MYITHKVGVHAVCLAAAEVLSEWLKPSMALWMIDCFGVAAARRFEALSIACDRAVTECTGQDSHQCLSRLKQNLFLAFLQLQYSVRSKRQRSYHIAYVPHT